MAAEFVKLCSDGDLMGVQTALQSGVDVNSRDDRGRTGLMRSLLDRHTGVMCALKCYHVACAELLISDERTDPNIKDGKGDSPLMGAVKLNYYGSVKLLISDKRTDPNIKDGHGDSPLMSAVKRNRIACAELLLADPRVDLMTRDNYERSGEEVTR